MSVAIVDEFLAVLNFKSCSWVKSNGFSNYMNSYDGKSAVMQ